MARFEEDNPRTTRRSEQIRSRRTSRTSQVTLPAKKRPRQRAAAQTERRDPPVMVRGSTAPRAAVNTKRGKARRRYDVALNVPGAEIRLPSVPTVSIGWRLLSFVVVAGLGFLLYQVWNSPKYRVADIEVTGLQGVTRGEVDAALAIENEPVFTLNAAELENRLVEAFPEFSEVSVKIGLPAEVSVTVIERTPVINWRQDGRSLLVDAQGVAIPVRSSVLGVEAVTALPADLPVVEASGLPRESALLFEEPQTDTLEVVTASAAEAEVEEENSLKAQPLLTAEMVEAVLVLSERAPAGQPLVYDPRFGLGWKEAGGWDVYLGNDEDVEMKLHVYDAILGHLQTQEVQPALISVQYVHAPYYQLEN